MELLRHLSALSQKRHSKKIGCILFFLLALVSCSGDQKKIAYFKAHPESVQKEAGRCIEKARQGSNIEQGDTCVAVINYEQAFCRDRQQEKAFFYITKDCNNKPQMLWLAYDGF